MRQWRNAGSWNKRSYISYFTFSCQFSTPVILHSLSWWSKGWYSQHHSVWCLLWSIQQLTACTEPWLRHYKIGMTLRSSLGKDSWQTVASWPILRWISHFFSLLAFLRRPLASSKPSLVGCIGFFTWRVVCIGLSNNGSRYPPSLYASFPLLELFSRHNLP